jgi:acetyl esterase/lipase
MTLPPFSSLRLAAVLSLLCTLVPEATSQDARITHHGDVIYGRKFGVALTMEIFRPQKNANGLGVISVLSGGWYSNHPGKANPARWAALLDRGYTVFAVTHGSQPKFSIPEILEDMHRAVRFIRFHAQDYGIDPDRIGITGSSAGGHLSLMQGLAGDTGNPKATDPVDRVSSRVQAVACFFPPTDFLNYGKPGENAVGRGILWNYSGAFGFTSYDPDWRRLVPITDEQKIQEIGRRISPISHASADDPPVLIFHGDKDWLVPLQQSETLAEKLKRAGVEVKLVVKPGADHGWPGIDKDAIAIAEWFDAHLKQPANPAAATN